MRINFLKSFSWRRWLSDHLFYFSSFFSPVSNLSCSLWVYVSLSFLLLVEILLTKLGTLLKKLYTNVTVCLNLFLINFKIIFWLFSRFGFLFNILYIYIIYFPFVRLDFVLRKKNWFPYRLSVLIFAIFMEQNTYV